MRGGPLALDGEGNVYLVGSFMSFVDLGQGQLKGWSGSDIYLASFTASGAYRFGKVMGGQGNDTCSGLAVSADGKSLYLAGSFADSIDFGGGSEASGKPQRWDATIFLVKLAVTSTAK